MNQARLFQIHPAPALGDGLDTQFAGQPVTLPLAGGKGLHRPDVGDDIDHLAAGARRLMREGVVDFPPANAEPDDGERHDRHETGERHRHHRVDGRQHDDGADKLGAGRNDAPGQAAQDHAGGIGRRRDPAAERAREMLAEIPHRVAGQMLEQVQPHIDPGRHHGAAPEPASRPPQHVLDGDQAQEQGQRGPDIGRRPVGSGHGVDQQLHPVLDKHGTGGRAHDHAEQPAKLPLAGTDIPHQKAQRLIGKRPACGGPVWHGKNPLRVKRCWAVAPTASPTLRECMRHVLAG